MSPASVSRLLFVAMQLFKDLDMPSVVISSHDCVDSLALKSPAVSLACAKPVHPLPALLASRRQRRLMTAHVIISSILRSTSYYSESASHVHSARSLHLCCRLAFPWPSCCFCPASSPFLAAGLLLHVPRCGFRSRSLLPSCAWALRHFRVPSACPDLGGV